VTIERIQIKDRAHWLSLRANDVTASAAGALLGVHEYLTPFQLYLEKTGQGHDVEETAPMRRGKRMEGVAIGILKDEHPEIEFQIPNFYVRDTDARIGATPDLLAICPKRGPGIVQIKSVQSLVYRRKWIDAELVTPIPPTWIMVQAIIEAKLTGANWAAVAPIVVDHGIDIPLIDIEIHAGVYQRTLEAIAEFWAKVDAGEPLPADYARDGAAIEALYAKGGGPALDLSKHNRIAFLCEEMLAWQERATTADRAKRVINAEIADILKDSEIAEHGEFKIARKSQKTGGYTVPEGKTRVLRITRKKQSQEME
jgi:hypothetical protein